MKNKVLMYFSLIEKPSYWILTICLISGLLTGFGGNYLSAQSQEVPLRCGTDEYSQFLAEKDPVFAKHYYGEESFPLKTTETASGIDIVIPVVVHILYNEQEQNISMEQVQSQMDRLNLDFSGENENIEDVPAEFADLVAYDTGIRFCLADTDPNGNPTDGIQRIPSPKAEYNMNLNEAKFESTGGVASWPTCEYLNVWVVPKIVNNGGLEVLGYTQLPGGPSQTEGIVIRHRYMGDNVGTSIKGQAPNINNFYKGRTLVHEIGHYLGLRHIWGDDDGVCSGDDLVADTPNQGNSTAGCVLFGNSCESNDMVMNYMDYTYDECMMMFSQGQKERMSEILTSLPSRNCLFAAESSSCGQACFAEVGEVIYPERLAVCNKGTSEAFTFCSNGPFYANLLLVVSPIDSTIIAVSDSAKVDFKSLSMGDYAIYPMSFKNNYNPSSLIDFGNTTLSQLMVSLDNESRCYDLKQSAIPILRHSAPLDMEIELNCQEDAFGYFIGDARLDITINGGTGDLYFIGPGNGDLLEHETEQFIRVQDSAGCFVQEFVEVDCPPFDYAAFGFNFLDNQSNITTGKDFKLSFNSPNDLPVFIRVFNLVGQQLVETQHDTRVGVNVLDFDTSYWTPGIYIVSLDNRNSMIQMKFMRQR